MFITNIWDAEDKKLVSVKTLLSGLRSLISWKKLLLLSDTLSYLLIKEACLPVGLRLARGESSSND